jgi:hypothetical protein
MVHSVEWKNWAPPFQQWDQIAEGIRELTEQQLQAEIAGMVGQWRWHGEIIELTKKDLVKSWEELISFDHKLATHGRWIDG